MAVEISPAFMADLDQAIAAENQVRFGIGDMLCDYIAESRDGRTETLAAIIEERASGDYRLKKDLRDRERVSNAWPKELRKQYPLDRWTAYRACVKHGEAVIGLAKRAMDDHLTVATIYKLKKRSNLIEWMDEVAWLIPPDLKDEWKKDTTKWERWLQ